jgi:hypothetical protein
VNIEAVSLELVKIFISHGMAGLLIHHNGNLAVRTINNKDGDSHVFAITKSTINIIHYNQNKKICTQISIVNTHDPFVEDQLEEVVTAICDDYKDEECVWSELPEGYEPFEPSDWWKYGASPV